MSDEGFKVGDEVAMFEHGGAFRARSIVTKIYKNGNLIVGGQYGQWRPYSDGTAIQTGDGWRKPRLHRITPDVEARIAQQGRARKLSDASFLLQKLLRAANPDKLAPVEAEMLALIERIKE